MRSAALWYLGIAMLVFSGVLFAPNICDPSCSTGCYCPPQRNEAPEIEEFPYIMAIAAALLLIAFCAFLLVKKRLQVARAISRAKISRLPFYSALTIAVAYEILLLLYSMYPPCFSTRCPPSSTDFVSGIISMVLLYLLPLFVLAAAFFIGYNGARKHKFGYLEAALSSIFFGFCLVLFVSLGHAILLVASRIWSGNATTILQELPGFFLSAFTISTFIAITLSLIGIIFSLAGALIAKKTYRGR